MTNDGYESIFGVVLWPALKTYVCVSLLGAAVFFSYSIVTDDYRSAGVDLTELISIIFGYGIFSLVLGFFVAFPPILLLGGLMNSIAKKRPKFGSAAAFALIGSAAGTVIMLILDYSISVRPSRAGPALLGGSCGFVGSLMFRYFTART